MGDLPTEPKLILPDNVFTNLNRSITGSVPPESVPVSRVRDRPE